jgi:hypothetical protein
MIWKKMDQVVTFFNNDKFRRKITTNFQAKSNLLEELMLG